MKISRQDIRESEDSSTALWLKEFAYDLEKNADVDYLRQYLSHRQNKSKKFNNIEEKLADLRHRVGLDLAIKISNEVDRQKTASACGCEVPKKGCSCSIKVASENELHQHSKSDVETMDNILKYIRDMIHHEPNPDQAAVLNRCRNEDQLRFNELEKKINIEKLLAYINSLIDEKTNSKQELVGYTPTESFSEFEADDRIADYYSHAEPYQS